MAKKTNFLARVQRAPKVVSIKAKIRKQKAALKKLGRTYKSLIKSESRRLSK